MHKLIVDVEEGIYPNFIPVHSFSDEFLTSDMIVFYFFSNLIFSPQKKSTDYLYSFYYHMYQLWVCDVPVADIIDFHLGHGRRRTEGKQGFRFPLCFPHVL